MNETVLLIDGDVLSYRPAAASEVRTINVTHNPSGKQQVFKTRTEFKTLLKSKDKLDKLEQYSIEDVQTPSPVSHCLHTINTTLRNLDSNLFPDRTEIWVAGKGNFRNELLLPVQYKSSRGTMLRPLLLDQAKEYLLTKYKAKKADGLETDDAIVIRAYEELANGNKPIIVTNDKDAMQAEGVFLYDYTKENPALFEVPTIGYLTKDKQTVKGCGLKFFAVQWAGTGDPTDGYCPYDLVNVRYGAASAYKDFKDLNTTEEILGQVILNFKRWYPEPFTYTAWNGTEVNATWETMVDLYFKAAYMKRSWDDLSDWRLFFAERGVQV